MLYVVTFRGSLRVLDARLTSVVYFSLWSQVISIPQIFPDAKYAIAFNGDEGDVDLCCERLLEGRVST